MQHLKFYIWLSDNCFKTEHLINPVLVLHFQLKNWDFHQNGIRYFIVCFFYLYLLLLYLSLIKPCVIFCIIFTSGIRIKAVY